MRLRRCPHDFAGSSVQVAVGFEAIPWPWTRSVPPMCCLVSNLLITTCLWLLLYFLYPLYRSCPPRCSLSRGHLISPQRGYFKTDSPLQRYLKHLSPPQPSLSLASFLGSFFLPFYPSSREILVVVRHLPSLWAWGSQTPPYWSIKKLKLCNAPARGNAEL